MSFVETKFPLPTVSKADGTLAGYVQYQGNPRGDQFIWPAQRIAIYLAKQKADAAKKKTSLGFTSTGAPAGPALTDPTPVSDSDRPIIRYNPTGAPQQVGSQQQTNSGQPPVANQGMSYALALGGILVGGGVIIALVKALSGGARTGRPIPGAHVYEGL